MYNESSLTSILPPAFFFYATATTEIYTLSLHDALPISATVDLLLGVGASEMAVPAPWAYVGERPEMPSAGGAVEDRKSTRLNSSHRCISYAVFCLKKKNNAVMASMRLQKRVTSMREWHK